MNRTVLLAILGVTVVAGGTAIAASDPPDRSVPLVAAASTGEEDDETTTSTTDAPSTTTTVVETTTTTTTEPPPPPTTAAPAPRAAGPLHLRCAGDGMKAASGSGETTDAWVYCELKGVDDRAAHLTLTRDGETIARTDDTGTTSYKDREVRAGQTYSYQAHAFTADGRPLQSSEVVRATASGGSPTYDGPLVLRCGGYEMKSASTTSEPVILCKWKGTPERATHLTLTRDGETILRTDDVTMSHHEDRDVTPGTTYSYELHAHAADGSVIESSGAVRATPGTGFEGA